MLTRARTGLRLLVVGAMALAMVPTTPALAAAATSVGAVTFATSASGAGYASTWTVNFTTSVSGALAAGQTVDLAGPSGTFFPTAAADYTVNGVQPNAVAPDPSSGSVAVTLASAVAASSPVTVVASGVLNPPGTFPAVTATVPYKTYAATDFAVWTADDPMPANPAAPLVFPYEAGTTIPALAGISVVAMVVDSTTHTLYALSQGATLYAIDTTTNQLTATVSVGGTYGGALAVDAATDMVYVVTGPYKAGAFTALTAINGSTGKVAASVPVNEASPSVAVDPTTDTIYLPTRAGLDVINGANNALTTIPMSLFGVPYVAVNAATDTVYMANPGAGALTVIDGATDAVVTNATLPFGAVAAEAVNPTTNVVYVLSSNGESLAVFNGATNSLTTAISLSGTVDIASGLPGLAVDPSTDTVYAGSTYNPNTGQGIAVIDGATNLVTHVLPRIGRALAVDPSTGNLYSEGSEPTTTAPAVHVQAAGTVLPPGPVASATATVTGPQSVHLTWSAPVIDGGASVTDYVVVARNADSAMPISAGSYSPVGTYVDTGSAVTSYTMTGLEPGVLYQFWVAAVNAAGAGPEGVVYGPNWGYSVPASNPVTPLPPASIALGGTPEGVAVDPVTHLVYVSNSATGQVAIINGLTDTVTGSIAVGSAPNAEAIDVATGMLYVTDTANSTVSVVDLASGTVVATVPVGSLTPVSAGIHEFPVGIAIDPNTDTIYVASFDASTVSAIDGATNKVVATIPVASNPMGIAVDTATNTVYVGSFQNAVTVIDGLTNAITNVIALPFSDGASFLVGGAAFSLGVDAATGSLMVGGENGLVVVDTQTQQVQGVIDFEATDQSYGGTTEAFFWAIATDPGRGQYYVVGTPSSGAGSVIALPATNNMAVYENGFGSQSPFGLPVAPAYELTLTQTSNAPYAAAVDPGLNTVYVSNPSAGTLTVHLGQTAGSDESSTTMTASAASSATGPVVTMTADVTSPMLGGPPTGTVAFYAGAHRIGSAPLSGGIATLTTTTLAGDQSLSALYSGSGQFAASESPTVAIVVPGLAVTTAALPAEPIGAAYNAILSASGPGAPYTWSISGGSLPAGLTLDASTGVISGTPTALGSTTITVEATNAASQTASSPLTIAIVPPQTTTSLSLSPTSPATGQSVTLTATVKAPAGTTPTGSVTFFSSVNQSGNYNEPLAIGTASLNATGVATLTVPAQAPGSYHLTAAYGGSASDDASYTSSVLQTVTGAPSATSVRSSAPVAASGEAVTFTATVAGTYPQSPTPTGQVTFYNGTTALGTATLDASATATYTTSSLATGTQSITAKYSGDLNYTSSTSAAFSQVVGSGALTTTTLSTNAAAAVFGQAVTFTAKVTTATTGTPTGTVTFYDGPTRLGAATLDASGSAAVTASSLPLGTDAVTATYTGTSTFAGGTSSPLSQVVDPDATKTALTSSSLSAAPGQAVTFTATVTASAPGAGTPTGTVTFYDQTAQIGTASLTSSGQATYTTSSLSTQTHSITAVYAGDTDFTTSTSPALSQEIGATVPTATTLHSSANPSVVGQAVTFTATVSATGTGTTTATPTGTVTFADASGSLGTGSLNSSGQATFTTSALAVATHSITAAYAGDANFNASTSAALSQAVDQAVTTITLTSSDLSAVVGQPVTFTATVTVRSPGAGAPTGTVTFYDGTTALGTGTLSRSGTATYSTSSLSATTHSITAAYAGDTNFKASTSGPLTQIVQKVATSLALTATPVALTACQDGHGAKAPDCRKGGDFPGLPHGKDGAPGSVSIPSGAGVSIVGQAVTLTATLTAAASGVGTPTGSVTFTSGATALGTAPLETTGGVTSASMTVATLPPGSQTIDAAYSGDSVFSQSSATVPLHVEYVFVALPPLDRLGQVDARQALPLAFRLLDAKGHVVQNASATLSVNGAPAVSRDPRNAADAFRFQGGAYRYNLNLGASVASAGTLTLAIALNDGTTHTFTLQLKGPKANEQQSDHYGNKHRTNHRAKKQSAAL